MEIIEFNDSEYPKRLKEIKNPPKKLYILGDKQILNNTSIAIVGSRDCDSYGTSQTRRFASYLAQKGITIISGLARGVDSIAHYYSIDKVGKTVAVIASGFDHIYPSENKILFNKIIENGGCVISEWPPETEVDMYRFPVRNRVISGLAVGTLVVEAKYRSGTNITAHNAMAQGRELFCIPGNINSSKSYGANRLIAQGGNLVTSPKDIIEILEYDGFISENEKKVLPEYEEVYNLIGNIPTSANEVSYILKESVIKINEILLMLEIDGFIIKNRVGKYIRNDN